MSHNIEKIISLVAVGPPKCGKSTILSHLLYDNTPNMQSKLTEIASGNWAWFLDNSEEERKNGTSHLKCRYLVPVNFEFSIFDVPSHVKNIVCTASGIASSDCVLFVVPATAGEFESAIAENGHLEEMVLLCSYLRVRKVIVAVSKMDTTEPKYSETRFQEVVRAVGCLLKKYFDISAIRFIPMSGLEGVNITKNGAMPWFGDVEEEKFLLDEMRNLEPKPVSPERPFRMIIQEVQKDGGDFHIIGKVLQGTVSPKNQIVVYPSAREFTVDHLLRNENSKSLAEEGHISIVVTGDASSIEKGMVISRPLSPLVDTRSFVARIQMRNIPMSYKVGDTLTVLCHNAVVPCRIKALLYAMDEYGCRISNPSPCISSGDFWVVEFETSAKSIVLDIPRNNVKLSAIALVDANKLVGGGMVVRKN